MSKVLFYVSASFFATSFMLMVLSLRMKRFQYWPPPSITSWQYYVFWGLGRAGGLCLIGLIILDWRSLSGARAVLQYGAGALLFCGGLILSLQAARQLGMKRTHGDTGGLVTSGPYAKSRNPQYVGVFPLLFGGVLIVNDARITCLLLLVAGIYFMCPVLEEPWLEAEYGEAYRQYKRDVPRFF